MSLNKSIVIFILMISFMTHAQSYAQAKDNRPKAEYFVNQDKEKANDTQWGTDLEYSLYVTNKDFYSSASTGYGYPLYKSFAIDFGVEQASGFPKIYYGLKSGLWAGLKEFSGNLDVRFLNIASGIRLQPYVSYRWLQSKIISLSPQLYINSQLGGEFTYRKFLKNDDFRIFPHTAALIGTGLSLRLYKVVLETHFGVGISNLRFTMENDVSLGFVF